MRSPAGILIALIAILLSVSFTRPAQAATLQVTNTDNTGTGSLRAAITAANVSSDFDVIEFRIPGAGPHTITLTAQLPIITSPVEITGETEEGWVAATALTPAVLRVEIVSPATALRIDGDDSIVRGITVRGSGTGILITADRVRVEGCHIGVSLSGLVDQGNAQNGIRLSDSANSIIGGTVPADRNVISGNADNGIELSLSRFTSVIGNYIGTDATGLAPLQNDDSGVRVQDGQENYIGDDLAGAGNVIAGNNLHGVNIEGLADRISVQNNYIGVKADGSGPVAPGTGGRNNDAGVRVNSELTTTTQIGGQSNFARNIISGNRNGILITNGPTRIEGNIIGLDPTGLFAIPNSFDGISGGDDSLLIGGVVPAARNIISGNTVDGVDLSGGTVDVYVQGNYIGTDITGTALIGNGGYGVNRITGLVGGTDPGHPNIIAGNTLGGVFISSTVMQVLRNSMFGNGGLGIDIAPAGVRANVAGSAQNYPIITAASIVGPNLQVSGTLNTEPGLGSTRISFFASTTCDSAGNGEGEVYLGETFVFANVMGDGAFTNVSVNSPGTRRFITALANRGTSQSEFSACFTLPALNGTLTGFVTLQGRGAPPNALYAVPLRVTVTQTGSGTPFYDQTVTTSTSGGFTVSDIPPGSYTVRVKHAQALSCETVTTVVTGENIVQMGTLRTGDASNDNVVNVGDFSLLAASFGLSSGAPGYNGTADFNADNVVNVSDFALLAANFGQAGGACSS